MNTLTINDIPVWLINLSSSTQRLEKARRQFKTIGADHTRFEAVNGKEEWSELITSVDVPAFEHNVGRTVIPGEIGCYHLHLRV
jgi:glycosyl transferase family 25